MLKKLITFARKYVTLHLFFLMTNHFPYILYNQSQAIELINNFSALGTPFLFIINYRASFAYVIPEYELNEAFVRFSFENEKEKECPNNQVLWQIKPVSKACYATKFDFVKSEIRKGNSFLTNLTQPTELTTNLSLEQLYDQGKARYKLWLKDRFTVLSPELFVTIEGNKIASFPMKGTIDASVPDAEALILNDKKEQAEHATIVDLIRNDLSIIANQVEVKRYRYIDRLKTNKGELLQVSSEITGVLASDFHGYLGNLLFNLLPAGSISGAPKPKTLQIIESAEHYERDFYTGVCGWFDGKNLNSAVMIRFIEQQGDKLIFKSGGGITSQSDMEKEYEELIQKVYVPIY
jgi:para-aminobenzoate synthetase component I